MLTSFSVRLQSLLLSRPSPQDFELSLSRETKLFGQVKKGWGRKGAGEMMLGFLDEFGALR